MLHPAASPIAWATSQIADRLGYDLNGRQVGYAGDAAGLALLAERYPRGAMAPLPADPAGSIDLVLIAGELAADDLATVAGSWLPHTRYLAATLPDAPGHWEALDALPVVHRFVFPDPPDGDRRLHFGFVVQGAPAGAHLRVRSAREMLLPERREPPLAEGGDRLLFLSDASWMRLLCGDYYDPARVRCLHGAQACSADCDAHFDPTREDVTAAVRRSFGSWEPTSVMLVCPEYFGIPPGVEECPWPTLAAISDWNVNFRNLVPCLGAFDLVVGDSSGMQLLRAQDVRRAQYWPMYSYDPALHVPGSGEKAHDLAFLGNLNHRVQRERSRYLHKVASLAGRHRVLVGAGYFGAEYAAVLQASALVFNRSIRGELNLRCYEAPACGAMLLLEDTNVEARTLFTPGVHFAPFGPDDLPDVVAAYLSAPEALAGMTLAGAARARASSYTAHFSGLLGLIRELAALPDRGPRPLAALPRAERLHRYGRLAYHRTGGDRLYQALGLLGRARDEAPA
ncbi:MAG: glycosyltransferase family 1 protein, partial [Candidatus Sericytochromatia bacterium]|nr:glycosyltransferase family 1 protein [Candidatus Tanganyikabacteria bacterium]